MANQIEKVNIMRSTITPKTIRRLVAADGYLELNMPERAITELHKVDDAGALEGPRQLLLGLAHKRAGDPGRCDSSPRIGGTHYAEVCSAVCME